MLGEFISMTDTITGFRKEQYLTRVDQTSSPQKSVYIPPDVKGKTKITYVVKEGDNLGFISEWYDVGLSEIRYWNNIYRNTIRIGQKITVYVDPSEAERYSKVNSMSFAEKQRLEGKPAIAAETASTGTGIAPSDNEYDTYIVRYGDTVWDIAKKFEGVTTTDIMSLNKLTDASKIQVGQKLRIRKKS